MKVDLILLSRDLSPPRKDVWRGIQIQDAVDLRIHRLEGTFRPEDPNRYATIARARNRARSLGTAPWVMFLDDDVVLGPGCVARLVEGLVRKSGFAALGADSGGEMAREWDHWDYPRHVGMAATLFRRERLAEVTFRWEPGKCECRCCCDDLRRAGFGIGYLAGAQAQHRPYAVSPARLADSWTVPPPQSASANSDRSDAHSTTRTSLSPRLRGEGRGERTTPSPRLRGEGRGEGSFRCHQHTHGGISQTRSHSCPRAASGTVTTGGRILTAFDRNHFLRFRRQFLTTLRASGNREPLAAVAYGLHPGERSILEAAGLEVFSRPVNGVSSALRRLRDFQDVVAGWPEDTPVAYWDAGDVLFQGSLSPLWDLVRAYPDRLLVAREPVGIGESPVLVPWTDHILDPIARRETRELLSAQPFINAGFAAGTVRALMGYLREGDRLLNTELKGVLHWGDQVAMGHYLHHNPTAWREVSDGWNYCIIFRDPWTYRIHPGGRVESLDRSPVHVVHGNGRTLEPWVMSFAS